MGVPALFRWLSKKYPKIILEVVEETPEETEQDGKLATVPVDASRPNPNGTEFDNLYLDMNGIVHPCTHPEGKPAPETEEEMMLEIFSYTERVVNMVRPRKLLMMAIDGVAPRAKMNQQRSRRFRSSQEAKDKEEAQKESVALWKAMGKEVTEENEPKKAWDSNAITPGTPFMDLLATALRYWVIQKTNQDPAWKQMQVIISDASVPGEGEHKIMDFIRRQRTNPGHDPNTRHVIYGLDADLIMLALATHEPYFRVLREDVFHQEGSSTACRNCKQEGHYAAQCTNPKAEKEPDKPAEKKPFIFLDVSILREYLEVELNVPYIPFAFDLERAIDDWVMLIFFVGNDFLPHLPSLEIREGAIDTLLKLWKDELPRMGGYITNHGRLEFSRVEFIIKGLAHREDDIFRKRREAEERQDQNAKRRKMEAAGGRHLSMNGGGPVAPSPALQLSAAPSAPPIHSSLPPRPSFDSFESRANAMGFGAVPAQSVQPSPPPAANPAAVHQAVTGSNHDWVANRRAVRMANMSAAEMLKAEMASLVPVNSESKKNVPLNPTSPIKQIPSTFSESPPPPPLIAKSEPSPPPPVVVKTELLPPPIPMESDPPLPVQPKDESSLPSEVRSPEPPAPPVALSMSPAPEIKSELEPEPVAKADSVEQLLDYLPGMRFTGQLPQSQDSISTEPCSPIIDTNNISMVTTEPDDPEPNVTEVASAGQKRKLEDVESDSEGTLPPEDDEGEADGIPALRVLADGTVEQEDTVRLWEPGYRERYYKQKFNVDFPDVEFQKQLTQSYIEGLAWVLHYYYQGTPSWQWYYPYHYAPFAQDFENIATMDVKFELGQPFKPFEQLMGVFPAASRAQIPETFHPLMTDPDSPIIDFYPEKFKIDMNGKRMAWQGVALLPFIDPTRLLDAMGTKYDGLNENEKRRNKWGTNVLYVSDKHPLYPSLEALYTKRKNNQPVPINPQLTKGINGGLLADPQCIPGSTYYCPLDGVDLPDLPDNRSLSALYYFPKQTVPHQSMILSGARRPPRILSSLDHDVARQGGRGRGRGRGGYDNSTNQPWNQRETNHSRPPPPRRDDWGGHPSSSPSYHQQYSQPHRSYEGGHNSSQSYYSPNSGNSSYGFASKNPGGYPGSGPSHSNNGGYGGRPEPGGYGGYGGYGGGGGGYGGYGGYGESPSRQPPTRGGTGGDRGRSRGWR